MEKPKRQTAPFFDRLICEYYDADEMDTYLAQKDEEIRELVDVLEGILNDTDSGCPMCDSGVLRNKEKEHWDDCVYYIAEQALNKHKTINE